MAYNQVVKYYQGYVGSQATSVDGVSQKIAGLIGLSLKGSYDLGGICADYSGNVYVTDPIRHIILKITESGNIINLAGLSGTSGDNSDTTVTCLNARFNYPTGIACDRNGDLYICDTNNHQIRKISNNKVSLVAGAATPTSGTADGTGNAARFNKPYGIDIDYSGIIYVADTFNHAIRKIKGGVVVTMAGLKGTSGHAPVWAQMTTAYGISGADARFNAPYSLTVDAKGYVFVLDTDNHVIKRIDPAGRVRIFSGSGTFGTTNGTAKVCRYQDLRYADITRSEELYVIDYNETGASRLMFINREGAAYPIVDWSVVGSGQYAAALVCNPAAHIIVVESEYPIYEYSSSSSSVDSSSSSSIDSSSSFSSSSVSSNSSSSVSSNSSSSVSSNSSSSSSSSVSSASSSSISSASSSSISSESSSSSTITRSSSSSSSSVSSASSNSSSSVSSVSSNSSSSNSSSSLSSASSSSLSSASSSSRSSASSNSSSSVSSNSSSSSSSLQGCEPDYCATGYSTSAINGTYSWTGDYYNGKAVYNNGAYNLWYSTGYAKWVISLVVGSSDILSIKVATGGCPDGTYDAEAGTMSIGECSSSSSSSLSSSSVSSLSSSSVSSASSSSVSSASSESSSSNSSSSISSASSESSSSNSSSSESSSSISSESSESSSSNSSSSESSSSLSSSSISSASSESSSSLSSSSLSSASSNSSSSNSSSSSTITRSSSSSSSSVSSSSSSSVSSSSSSSVSSSSSSSSLQGCEPQYCATTFTTSAINGTYSWTGDYYNGKAVYNNGTYHLWYSTVGDDYWAISVVYPTIQGNWVSGKNVSGGCPDGTYEDEAGIMSIGSC